MKTPTAVSADYPKWLYKAGSRDVMVPNAAAEELERSRGYSHEYIGEAAAPAMTFGTQQAVPQRGTVPTAVMDAALADLKAKFDRAWDVKCEELTDANLQHVDLKNRHRQLTVDHEALTAAHSKIAEEYAKVLAEQNAAMEVAKPAKKG